MAGHLGDSRVTTQNLIVVSTDRTRGLIFIRGAVPGSKGSYVLVQDAVKKLLPEAAPFPAGVRGAGVEAAEEKEEASAEAETPAETKETPEEETAPKEKD